MLIREKYLKSLTPFIEKPVIKAITGIRRCGKSTLLLQLIGELERSKVDARRIIYINKELLEFSEIKNYKDLYNYVKARTPKGTRTSYLFVDEIQEIEEWERAIISLLAESRHDIYITGSNAHLLSSELATLQLPRVSANL